MRSIHLSILLLFVFSTSFAQERVVNYDEDKAGSYLLPDILKTEDGKKVETVAEWEDTRRPELLRLFEDNVYGQVPKDFDKLEFAVVNSDAQAMGGKAEMKEVQVKASRNGESVTINLVLFVPSKRKGKVPAFLLINNRSARNTAALRDTLSGFWPAEMVIEAGYAVAAFQVDDAAPDNKDRYAEGVLKLYPEQLQKQNGMKAIGAWGWAASRVLDYFKKNEDIDASKVAVVGHSRGGKASLWAAAEDQRFAMCFSNNSGNTGAALSRRWFGETVKIINTSFPHWFSENYKKYNDNEKALPVDQHMLIGLIAPRPVYVTNATEDLWADPQGSFLAVKEAAPVYELYKHHPHLPATLPAPNTPSVDPPMGYHLREGIHNLTEYDWSQFIEFADRYYKSNMK